MIYRRILHQINFLRTKLKHQYLSQIDHIDYHAYSDTDMYSPIQTNRSTPLSFCQHEKLKNKYSKFKYEKSYQNLHIEHELKYLLKRKKYLEFRIKQLQQNREQLTTKLDQLNRIQFNSRLKIFNSHDHLSLLQN